MPSHPNPCLTCGACCAFYRVAFYWAEADDGHGAVPAELTEKLDHHRRAMKGTNQPQPRCIALEGEIGSCVRCIAYDHRPSICRELKFSWEDGQPSEQCDKARQAWGLPPLSPAMFQPEFAASGLTEIRNSKIEIRNKYKKFKYKMTNHCRRIEDRIRHRCFDI